MNLQRIRGKTALFWLLTTLLVLGVNAYFASHVMYRNQAREIDENYARLTATFERARQENRSLTLVVGNSYVAASVITDAAFPSDVGWFATGGLPLATLVDIVEHLPADAPVDLLVVGLAYTYASPAPSGQLMHRAHWTENPLTRAWYSLPLIRAGDSTSEMVKYSLCRLFAGRPGRTGRVEPDSGCDDRELCSADHRRDIKTSIEEQYRQYVPFTGRVSVAFAEYLIRLQAVCDQRSIRLETFTAPIHCGVRDRLDPAFLEEFHTTVVQSGVRTVDLNLIFPDWDESHFNDATHLSRIGRRMVRDYLRDYIISRNAGTNPPLW